MKKYQIHLLIFASLVYVSSFVHPQTYTWSPKIYNPLISKVQLKNGTVIKLKSACQFDDEKCQGRYDTTHQIVGITADGLHEEIIVNYFSQIIQIERGEPQAAKHSRITPEEAVENTIAIEDFFGDKVKAALAIVSERCNRKHELCNRTHTYLIVPEKTFFRKYYVGSNVRSITVNLNAENEIIDAKAVVSTGTDKYGTGRYTDCNFIKNVGFIAQKTQPKYLQLLLNGAGKREIFDDKAIQRNLAKHMGLPRFRLLRKNTSWDRGTQYALKRYIVFEGCQRYLWDMETGILFIDTFTGNSWWEITTTPTYPNSIHIAGGTVEMPKEVRSDFNFIKKYMNYHDCY